MNQNEQLQRAGWVGSHPGNPNIVLTPELQAQHNRDTTIIAGVTGGIVGLILLILIIVGIVYYVRNRRSS
jgi:hypothetical protein